MTELSPTLKRQITKDWHSLFPQMAVFKPMWLARRVGPLVQGICLDRSSANVAYYPTTHLHNLCRPFPVVSLSLNQRLLDQRSGTEVRIAAAFHNNHYLKAAHVLAPASLLSLAGDLTMSQIIDAHRNYRLLNRADSAYPVMLLEDEILLFAWFNQIDRAEALLQQHVKEMCHWPANVMAADGGV